MATHSKTQSLDATGSVERVTPHPTCQTCQNTHKALTPVPVFHGSEESTELESSPCPDCCIECSHCGKEAWEIAENGYRQLYSLGRDHNWCDADCAEKWLDAKGTPTIESLRIALNAQEFHSRDCACDTPHEPECADQTRSLTDLILTLLARASEEERPSTQEENVTGSEFEQLVAIGEKLETPLKVARAMTCRCKPCSCGRCSGGKCESCRLTEPLAEIEKLVDAAIDAGEVAA